MGVFRKVALLGFVFNVAALAAAESFTVDDIVVNGLQRVSLGSVLTELSVSKGDIADEADASNWLHQVYQTGYFYSVNIERLDNDLVINVVERPAIESIEFDGNSTIPTETLKMVFEDVGLAKGEIYSQSLLESIQLELEKQYGTQGRYNAQVTADITALTRNRVSVKLNISEGPVAKIKHIQLVGNRVFERDELQDVIQLQETRPASFWQGLGKRNHFSSAALTGDLQRLEDFYFDRGYLDFSVVSKQVSISENKADIAIALNVVEGEPYTISKIDITGDLKHLSDEIGELVTVQAGEVYSRADVTAVVADIKELLGEHGYAFAQVRDFRQPTPETNEVDVIIQVNPGYPVYVNRIIIQGNVATNDEVIRRELRQLERALVVNKNIRTSKARLERLGYFSSVNIKTQAIATRNDLVDLIVTVEEAKDSQINISGGYSDGSGFFGEFSVKQSNFMGAGVDFSASVNVNESTQNYQLSVDNPFFTLDGVSLGTDLYYRHSKFSEITFSTYRTNTYGGRLKLGYPLSENQRISYGFGLSHDELFLNESNATLEMTDFRDQNGSEYDIATAQIGWSYNTLNGTLKADDGAQASLNVELATLPGDLNYYRTTLAAQKYFNFADNLAFRLHTDLGYGAGYGDESTLPFYKNFYAGGARSVRGYQSGSLGPLGTPASSSVTASPIGGNIKIEYGAELLIPTPIVKDQRSYRTSLFVDAGNVFTDQCRDDNLSCTNGVQLDEIRYSAGVDFTWITPIAPLSFSYAWPLNAQEDDYTTNFSFNIGISY
ncbi:outer membrane protein assembly factor BamA [Reinekea sp. G2M2-21]|uniref:outer membrane protein assembly factor BamA n=1 Tax=Reinekea sp. G2M2-21 TaxID=2788942 RepID=UPI0018AA9E83|nr:outer membrane protein assembly factor BamA [Reinekea sp. G2M2-21]